MFVKLPLENQALAHGSAASPPNHGTRINKVGRINPRFDWSPWLIFVFGGGGRQRLRRNFFQWSIVINRAEIGADRTWASANSLLGSLGAGLGRVAALNRRVPVRTGALGCMHFGDCSVTPDLRKVHFAFVPHEAGQLHPKGPSQAQVGALCWPEGA